MTTLTPVQALQKVLAGEHAAVYLYGVLGAQSSKSRQPALFAALEGAYDGHRDARDELTVLISDKGEDPVAAAVSYQPPGQTGSPRQIIDTALLIEKRLTMLYGEVVGHTSGEDRAWAIEALDRSAVRELRFDGRTRHFPGLS